MSCFCHIKSGIIYNQFHRTNPIRARWSSCQVCFVTAVLYTINGKYSTICDVFGSKKRKTVWNSRHPISSRSVINQPIRLSLLEWRLIWRSCLSSFPEAPFQRKPPQRVSHQPNRAAFKSLCLSQSQRYPLNQAAPSLSWFCHQAWVSLTQSVRKHQSRSPLPLLRLQSSREHDRRLLSGALTSPPQCQLLVLLQNAKEDDPESKDQKTWHCSYHQPQPQIQIQLCPREE